MTTHDLLAVVLPAGRAIGGGLRANVFLTPRLGGASELASFPDWLDWTRQVQTHGIQVTLACGTRSVTVAADPSGLRPDVWSAVFTAHTIVDPVPVGQFVDRLVVSYPVRDAYAYLKWAYQIMAAATVLPARQRILSSVLEGLSFRTDDRSTLDIALSQLRVDMWKAQNPPAPPPTPRAALTPAIAPVQSREAIDGAPSTTSRPVAVRDMIERFALYHRLPPAPGRPPLPSTPEELARLLDFHKALTALAAYPSLLPALGLVLPLDLPESLCPPSPATSAADYETVGVSAVTPGWAWSVPPHLVGPATAYVRDATTFAAAPATPVADVPKRQYENADVAEGFVALTADSFQLIGVELDGALLKAMSLADNLSLPGNAAAIDEVLPSLRSSGISLIANARGERLLGAIRDNQAFESLLQAGGTARPLNARDVVRGYRLDVWSARAGTWRSLHRRDGTYRFGQAGEVVVQTQDEEGFTQLAVAQPADDPTRKSDAVATAAGVPQPSTDLYVHERMARWNGWALSASRPGQPLNRSSDPAQATASDPTAGAPATPFKMTTAFAAHPGSLPQLRFGDRYRVRARAVDIAGTSVTLSAHVDDALALPPRGATLPYLRYEPVGPPVVVLRTPPGPGGSHLHLVIRSRNADPTLDRVPTGESDERHIVPPRAPVQLVEHHGLLDDSQGRLRADAATYALITARDRGEFPSIGGAPIEPGDHLDLPYFPDPLARRAALGGLPNTNANADGAVIAGKLTYEVPPDVEAGRRPSSMTHVGFGTGWPERQAFRIRLVDGGGMPAWDDGTRVLTISIEKARSVAVPLSSCVDSPDLDLLGVWNWTREFFEALDAEALQQSAGSGTQVVSHAKEMALLTRMVLDGSHEMITPALKVVLTHAVQQPIGRPTWTRLPIVYHPGSPVAAASLTNSFAPITAWRSYGSHHAVLLGGLTVHGASSASVDIDATWTEWVDDPDQPAPAKVPTAGHVERITLSSLVGGELPADGTGRRKVAVYVPEIDTLWFATSLDALAGVTSPASVAAPIHQVGDTKHRQICYRTTASSRFQEYFKEPGLEFTRRGDGVAVDVPSSARPMPPDVAYVVPIFGWERQESTNVKTDVRFGNGLRVYLHRPWFSSGQDELLGVTLWPRSTPAPDDTAREQAKHVITQWGLDPTWTTGPLAAVPSKDDFPLAVRSAETLTLQESPQQVDVSGHEVSFDADRRLWYCDIVVNNGATYQPFVRLALARFQPRSIQGVELSHVTLADFAQLTADRTAALSADPSDLTRARLVVGGVAPEGPTRSLVSVRVERRVAEVQSDLGWATAPLSEVRVIEDLPVPSQPDSVLWSGSIVFGSVPAPGMYRVVVRELELLEIDPPAAAASDGPEYDGRLVYASILPFDFPPPLDGR